MGKSFRRDDDYARKFAGNRQGKHTKNKAKKNKHQQAAPDDSRDSSNPQFFPN